ncbi:MAG: hypothetical protein Q9218_006926 [Villophora microphyllina]
MASTGVPEITITLSLSPTIYRFTNPTPPELTLIAVSDADRPFTVFSQDTVLHLDTALRRRCFTITDLTAGVEVPQDLVKPYRAQPFRRTRGSGSERYFVTLEPGIPVILSTSFGPARDSYPQPNAFYKPDYPLDKNGDATVHVHGVDGLIPGHRYCLSVAIEELQQSLWWWQWGTKDEVLVELKDPHPWLDDAEPEAALLKLTPIQGIDFSVEH